MDAQTLINLAFTAIGCLAGFILNSFKTSMLSMQESDAKLAEKVQQIEVLVAGKYLTVDKHSEDMQGLFSLLRRIDDKLDNAPCKNHGSIHSHNHDIRQQ